MPLKGHTTTQRIVVTNTADEFWVKQYHKGAGADEEEDRWCQVRLATHGDNGEVTVAIFEKGKEIEVHTIPFDEFFEQFQGTFFPGY